MADHASSGARLRPTSPHLQIYRWSPTMATSIVHRLTGMALTLGMAGLAWWLIALATGPKAYALFTSLAFTPLGQIIIFGFIWSLCFHLLSGFRHLIWDIGIGFGKTAANRVSVVIILLSVIAALGLFWAAYAKMGMI